jgi:hypothetical protein
MSSITSLSQLRSTAIANTGVFSAAFARAPRSVTYGGKTYSRDAAKSVDERLWYLAAAARTQPSAIAAIASGSYSLDEVYGLDPDRSGLDEAEAALRAASAKVGNVKAKLDGVNRQIKNFEANLARALAAQKEAQKVQVGDVLTGGISAAARNLYADGQVKIWKDRIESFQTGSLVGMAGQEGFQIPLNAGQSQLQAALTEAKADESAARQAVVEARAAYDRDAAARRREEEAARAAQARDENERRRAEAEAAAREQAAAQASQQQTQTYANAAPAYANNDTDPGYVEDDGYVNGGDDAAWYEEELDTARDLFGDEDDAMAYAQDVLGVDDDDVDEAAMRAYVSPYGFDSYYSAGAMGLDEDDLDDARLAYLQAGWGFDVEAMPLEYDSEDDDGSFGADKITDEGDQGYSAPPFTTPPMPPVNGGSDRPFDFMSVLPIIIAAVLALAPVIISSFTKPTSVDEGNAVNNPPAPPPPEPKSSASPAPSSTEALGYGAGALILLKLLS